MNILVFIHSLAAGGAERVTAALANMWVEGGNAVTIVTLASRSEDRYGLDARVQRVELGQVTDGGGIPTVVVANGKRIAALRNVLRRGRPDVALSMMSTSNVLLALAAIGLNGVATFGSERVHPPHVGIGKAWHFLRAHCYRLLDGIVAQTTQTRDWLLSNTNARAVDVIPNPVVWPLEAREPIVAPAVSGRPNRKLLLAVGRLEYQKGFDILMPVFSELARDFPHWDLAIVGQGSQRGALQAAIADLGLDGRAFLVGDVGNVGDWYEAADLFAFPSRFEGFPNALAEAMAYGVAAVSFDCETGPRDLITSGEDGMLVPVGDAEALSSSLRRLMADADARQALGTRAREVRERFALSRVGARWLELFRGSMSK
ncbi:MAG TPA: glycosyltransferase family 4 protein [Gemmatimonadaceae bacterium]|nr:glycosyltransferase family 4 protein [Gemmatimonadaceae bacterium]